MSNQFWNGEDDEFRDIPDEANLDENGNPIVKGPSQNIRQTPKAAPIQQPTWGNAQPQPVQHRPTQTSDEELIDSLGQDSDSDFENDEDDYSEVLSDASLRLEQGNLYKMIMNHDLFSGMETDARAAKSVQKQIRKFAKEQMEVMLGMRQASQDAAFIVSPFNDLEIEVLKRLASTATKGATETEEANTYTPPEPKRMVLNPIGMPAKKQAPKPIQRQNAMNTPSPASKPTKKLPSAPSKPMDRVRQQFVEAGLPDEPEKPIGKKLSELTEAEITARNERINERQAGKIAQPRYKTPQPTYEQQAAYYAQRSAMTGSNPSLTRILDAVNGKIK